MKRRLFALLLALSLLPLSSVSVMSKTINLGVGYEDPEDPFGDYPRSPILVPEVDIDGYTLTFYTPCDSYMLRLVDENDAVVYSTIIPTGSPNLVFPSYLSGEYQIQIIPGNLYFWGYITL